MQEVLEQFRVESAGVVRAVLVAVSLLVNHIGNRGENFFFQILSRKGRGFKAVSTGGLTAASRGLYGLANFLFVHVSRTRDIFPSDIVAADALQTERNVRRENLSLFS